MTTTTKLLIQKVTSLPSTFTADTIYMVPSSLDSNKFELYMTNNGGTQIKHIINQSEIQTMIDVSLANFNQTLIVADIAARDALTLTKNTPCWVINATGDTTVASGAALYLYDFALGTWTKISEAESMDVVVDWSMIQNKPISTVVDIDDAVARRHSHANKSILDLISTDATGDLNYNNLPIGNALSLTQW